MPELAVTVATPFDPIVVEAKLEPLAVNKIVPGYTLVVVFAVAVKLIGALTLQYVAEVDAVKVNEPGVIA